MTQYIATFHTHLSAMRTQRSLLAAGASARLSPVPRALSASCGTCVRYESDGPQRACMDTDFEKVVEVREGEQYTLLFENE